MAPDEPRVGKRYSCEEQSKMHGDDRLSTLPDSDGRVTLIRFRRDKNPNGPHIIEHGSGPAGRGRQVRARRMGMLRRQGGSLPVYRYVGPAAWGYLGRYRVRSITDGGPEADERRKITDRNVRYVVRLEEASSFFLSTYLPEADVPGRPLGGGASEWGTSGFRRTAAF